LLVSFFAAGVTSPDAAAFLAMAGFGLQKFGFACAIWSLTILSCGANEYNRLSTLTTA
jgi:hypothetical protein